MNPDSNVDDAEIDHIEGWVIAEDTETGKNYWANIYTQETTWDEPEAVQKHKQMQVEAKQQSRRMTKMSKNDWVAVVDQDSGDTYYFNKVTRETTWDKPADYVEHSNVHQEDKDQDKPKEKAHEDVVFQEKKSLLSHGGDNKFIDKALTVVSDEKKEISKLDQYSDVFRQATEYNFDNTPYSPDALLDFSTIEKDVIKKTLDKKFNEFCEEYLPKRTSWGKPIPNEKILAFQSKSLGKPITSLPKNVESVSFQTFKNILSYCGERKSSKKEIRHAQKLILMGMNAPSEVRDEIYFQIIKQLHKNPNKDKYMRVWRIFAILSSVFPPSEATFYPILNYLYEASNDKSLEEDVRGYAKYCFKRCVRGFEDDVRKEPPSGEEILYVEAKKQIMVPFYFMTGSNTFVPVESYSNAGEVKEIIFRKLDLNLQRLPYYSLYEICEKNDVIEERFIENNERILDLLSSWEVEKKSSKTNKPEFKMYLRVRVFYPLKENDLDTVTMYYTQMVYDVTNGRMPLKEVDIITLASLQLQVDYGDYKGNFDKLLEKLESYIPTNKYEENSPKAWLDKILPIYSKLAGYRRHDARLAYLDYTKNFNLYLSQQYFVKYSKRNPNDEDLGIPENVSIVLAIKPSHVLLCDAITKEPFPNKEAGVHIFEFKDVVTWGVSTEFFVLVVGNHERQDKIYLETSQGKAIDFLMGAYTNLTLGKSIQQHATSLTHATKKTADSLKVNTKQVVSRNATVFPKKMVAEKKK